jgi:hypothetical protein
MTEISKYVELIRDAGNSFGESYPEPIAEDYLETFRQQFFEYFQENPDRSFEEFLGLADGLQENGCLIFASKNYDVDGVEYGIFWHNLVVHQTRSDRKYIVYAESESVYYGYDKESKEHVAFFQMGGEVLRSYSSCEEMLVYVMRLMLNEEVE